MRRILSVIIAVSLTAAALCACGKKEEPAMVPEVSETVKTETTAAATAASTAAAVPETTAAPETVAEEPEEDVETPVVFHPLVINHMETGQQPDTNLIIYEVSCPEVLSSESEGTLYSDLYEAVFRDYKKCLEEVNARRNELAEKELAETPYKHMLGAEIMRADSKVLSVKYGFSGWYGGAHDDYSVTGRNYRTETGELLSAADIFKDQKALAEVIKERLVKQYPDVEFFSLDETIDGYVFDATPDDTETSQYSFCLTGDGVVFWFSPYELASFADGMQVIMLQYDEYPELIKKEFRVSADSYTAYLDNDALYTCSVGEIAAGARFDENGTINKISITVDGKEKLFDTYAYSTSYMLINNEEMFYMYVFETADDDETFIDVFDLSSGEAEYSGRFEGSMYKEYDHTDAIDAPEGVNASLARITVYSITDPKEFLLDSKGGAAEYHVGDDGMPEKN